jgi:hypothetical protein
VDCPDNPYVDCANLQASVQSVQDYTEFLENRLPLRLSESLGRPLYGSDDPPTRWIINMALEETLPTVLQELRREYEALKPDDKVNGTTG